MIVSIVVVVLLLVLSLLLLLLLLEKLVTSARIHVVASHRALNFPCLSSSGGFQKRAPPNPRNPVVKSNRSPPSLSSSTAPADAHVNVDVSGVFFRRPVKNLLAETAMCSVL